MDCVDKCALWPCSNWWCARRTLPCSSAVMFEDSKSCSACIDIRKVPWNCDVHVVKYRLSNTCLYIYIYVSIYVRTPVCAFMQISGFLCANNLFYSCHASWNTREWPGNYVLIRWFNNT